MVIMSCCATYYMCTHAHTQTQIHIFGVKEYLKMLCATIGYFLSCSMCNQYVQTISYLQYKQWHIELIQCGLHKTLSREQRPSFDDIVYKLFSVKVIYLILRISSWHNARLSSFPEDYLTPARKRDPGAYFTNIIVSKSLTRDTT